MRWVNAAATLRDMIGRYLPGPASTGHPAWLNWDQFDVFTPAEALASSDAQR